MSHYNSYDSFNLRKSKEKKMQAKSKLTKYQEDFILKSAQDYGVVVEVKYHEAFVYYKNEIVLASMQKNLNLVCNQVLLPGDKVVLSFSHQKYFITNMLERTSLLSRVKKDSTRVKDVGKVKSFAANIDMAIIVVAAHEPPLHPKFIDRYLMILQNSNIPFVICLNKCDLKTQEEEKILNVYRKLGIIVIETSTYHHVRIDELKQYIKDKQAILVGNSGVGKSSLINAIMGKKDVKTGHVSVKSGRGRHTTTISKYYVWDINSSIIDTPGIRSLDVSSFEPIEVQDYFKEFKKFKNGCKYTDCLHYLEQIGTCKIKQEVINHNIDKNRYESYLRIMSDLLKSDKVQDILKEMNTYHDDSC